MFSSNELHSSTVLPLRQTNAVLLKCCVNISSEKLGPFFFAKVSNPLTFSEVIISFLEMFRKSITTITTANILSSKTDD